MWERGCHLFCLCSKLIFFRRSSVHCSKSSYAHQTSQKKLTSGVDTNNFTQRLTTSTTILQLKVYIVYVVQKLVGHPLQQECPINLDSLVFPFVCNARSLDLQFFLCFPHEVSHHIKKKGRSQFLKISSDGLGLEGLKVSAVQF